MDIKTALEKIKKKIEQGRIIPAGLEAEAIIAFVLKKSREHLFAHPEKKISFWQWLKIRYLTSKRLAGFPIAYLTRHKEFYGLDFLVNRNVLVPRPETELMVDETIKTIKSYKLPVINLIDVGTGSGCVIISLFKKLKENGVSGKFYGLDISKKALAVAKKNAKANGVSSGLEFLHSDLLAKIDLNSISGHILITANLPYLSPAQIERSPSIRREPKIALAAGQDGLDCYRRLFSQLKEKLPEGRSGLSVFCEIDEGRAKNMVDLAKKILPNMKTEIRKDLGGYDRLAVLKA